MDKFGELTVLIIFIKGMELKDNCDELFSGDCTKEDVTKEDVTEWLGKNFSDEFVKRIQKSVRDGVSFNESVASEEDTHVKDTKQTLEKLNLSNLFIN